MENAHAPTGDMISEADYRQQIQSSIVILTQQLNHESTLEGKALIEEKLDQLKEQLGRSTEPKEISMQRITHLEEIFKHYCTHIFRVGKHMTFDRLDYEKVHMGMDRFFKFLSDFKLTLAMVDGKERDVVSKSKIITVFKKVSSTSKDLTFEEFIQCLEKLGPIYYDEKESYNEKVRLENERRRKIKENVEKQKAARKALNERNSKLQEQMPASKDDEGEQEQEEAEAPQEIKKSEGAENDELVRQMMENPDNIEHPVEEVDTMIKEKQEEIEKKIAQNKEKAEAQLEGLREGEELNRNDSQQMIGKSNASLLKSQSNLKMSTEEKVELFYKMIGVDNIKDYRNKLSELNLPLFKINHGEKKPIDGRESQPLPEAEAKSDAEDEEALRLQKIKEKINEKKALVRNQTQSPKKVIAGQENDIRKQQQERRMKKEKERERLEKARRMKDDEALKKAEQSDKKKDVAPSVKEKGGPVFKESNVTWDGIEKLNFEQLNLKQFHPHNLYNLEPEDEDYMGDLKFDLKNLEKYRVMNRVREKKENDKSMRSSVAKEKREMDRIAQEKERKVEAVVSGAKKRASEMEKSEKTKQKNIEHLSRKLSQSKTPRKVKT